MLVDRIAQQKAQEERAVGGASGIAECGSNTKLTGAEGIGTWPEEAG